MADGIRGKKYVKVEEKNGKLREKLSKRYNKGRKGELGVNISVSKEAEKNIVFGSIYIEL
jgi:hypothetical protein